MTLVQKSAAEIIFDTVAICRTKKSFEEKTNFLVHRTGTLSLGDPTKIGFHEFFLFLAKKIFSNECRNSVAFLVW